jgi:hypothetical protein
MGENQLLRVNKALSPRAGLGTGSVTYVGYCAVALPLGRAASCARSACHVSYSGVPRRGGASDGNPPIHCGMSATGLLPVVVHPVSNGPARSRNGTTNLIRPEYQMRVSELGRHRNAQ